MTISPGGDEFLFTSDSVTEGHPDQIADQISDAVLDRALAADPYYRVACETMLTTGLGYFVARRDHHLHAPGHTRISSDRP